MITAHERLDTLFDIVAEPIKVDYKRGIEPRYAAPLLDALAKVDLTPAREDLLIRNASPTLRRLFNEAHNKSDWANVLHHVFRDLTAKSLQQIVLVQACLDRAVIKDQFIVLKSLLKLEMALATAVENFNLFLKDQPGFVPETNNTVFDILADYQNVSLPKTRALIDDEARRLGLDAWALAQHRQSVCDKLGQGSEYLQPIRRDAWKAAAPAA